MQSVQRRRNVLPYVIVGLIALLMFASVLLERHGVSQEVSLVTDTQGRESPPSTTGPTLRGADAFYTVSAGNLCVARGDIATIASVEPNDAHGGLEVTAFSVFRRSADHPVIGDEEGRLGDVSDFRGGQIVGSECGDDLIDEIALELYKPRAEDAWASDFTVRYVANGKERTTNLRLGVALCEKKGCKPSTF